MVRNLIRNQAPGNRLRVRIPCPPLRNDSFSWETALSPTVMSCFRVFGCVPWFPALRRQERVCGRIPSGSQLGVGTGELESTYGNDATLAQDALSSRITRS